MCPVEDTKLTILTLEIRHLQFTHLTLSQLLIALYAVPESQTVSPATPLFVSHVHLQLNSSLRLSAKCPQIKSSQSFNPVLTKWDAKSVCKLLSMTVCNVSTLNSLSAMVNACHLVEMVFCLTRKSVMTGTHFLMTAVHLIVWQSNKDGNVRLCLHHLVSLTVTLQAWFHCQCYRSQRQQQRTKSSSFYRTQCLTFEIGCFSEKRNSNKSWISRSTDYQILRVIKNISSSTLLSSHLTVSQSKAGFCNNSHRLTHSILHFTSSSSSQSITTPHRLFQNMETWSHWTTNRRLWSSRLLWAKCKCFHLRNNSHLLFHCTLTKTTWFNSTHLITMHFTQLLSSYQRLSVS